MIFGILIVAVVPAKRAAVRPSMPSSRKKQLEKSTPVVYSTSLIDKHISDGRNSTFYYFTVELENGGEKDLGVTPEYYRTQEPGEVVTVVEQSGLLGIDYVYIDEGE